MMESACGITSIGIESPLHFSDLRGLQMVILSVTLDVRRYTHHTTPPFNYTHAQSLLHL